MKNKSMLLEGSKIGYNLKLGYYSVVGENVKIGDNVVIGNNVTIHNDSVIGNNVRIDDNTVIGKLPMRVRTSALDTAKELKPCTVSDNCVIGTSVVLYRGCSIGAECLVADLATIREDVAVGNNTIVGRGAAVENCCTIGAFCKLETNVYVTAYSEIQDHVFIAPGVITSNDIYAARGSADTVFKGVTVKRGGRIGAQATVLPGITINEDGFAAAGSMVTKDIPEAAIHCGNPARYMKPVPDEQQLGNILDNIK